MITLRNNYKKFFLRTVLGAVELKGNSSSLLWLTDWLTGRQTISDFSNSKFSECNYVSSLDIVMDPNSKKGDSHKPEDGSTPSRLLCESREPSPEFCCRIYQVLFETDRDKREEGNWSTVIHVPYLLSSCLPFLSNSFFIFRILIRIFFRTFGKEIFRRV